MATVTAIRFVKMQVFSHDGSTKSINNASTILREFSKAETLGKALCFGKGYVVEISDTHLKISEKAEHGFQLKAVIEKFERDEPSLVETQPRIGGTRMRGGGSEHLDQNVEAIDPIDGGPAMTGRTDSSYNRGDGPVVDLGAIHIGDGLVGKIEPVD
ncbi:MAG: hypothetical protein KAS32_31200 [Candidatus Peribacteraceae bacterium]|nr:hypothetical protein [Candidatus Peribacteraceae bacterium]